MQTCTPDKVGEIVLKQFTLYAAQVQSKLSEETMRVGQECAKKLRKISPKRQGKNGGRYAKGWRVKKDTESPYTVSVVVHNKTDYQLTHLLEHGLNNYFFAVITGFFIFAVNRQHGAYYSHLLGSRIGRADFLEIIASRLLKPANVV